MNAIDNVVRISTSHNFNLAECLLVVHIMTGGTELRLNCSFLSKRLEDNKQKFSAPLNINGEVTSLEHQFVNRREKIMSPSNNE